MSLCASCGLSLWSDAELCPHHHCVYGDDWAAANRIMCDFFHRKKIPPRLDETERFDTTIPATPAELDVAPIAAVDC